MSYLPRLVDSLISDLLTEVPAVLLAGPRASGKTTTGRRQTVSQARLDRPSESAAARLDPDVFLANAQEPLLIDEWQQVPEIMGALKRAIDDGVGNHRFVVTGSSQADLGPGGWPATGRLVRVPLWGLTMREQRKAAESASIVDVLFSGNPMAASLPSDLPDLRGYVEIALRSGFPEIALTLSESVRRRRLASYVDEIVRRDSGLAQDRKDPRLMRRYLEALAANTAGIVEHKTLFDAAQITRVSAVSYDSLLEMLYISEQVPAWRTNRLQRLIHAPKRYLVDPALMGPLLDIDVRSTLRDADLVGRVVDTLVVSQLRPELAVARNRVTFSHLRSSGGRHEVDLILSAPRNGVVAVEVKASSAPNLNDAKHLLWLRDELGPEFICGVVFHTGTRKFTMSDRIVALPVCSIWGTHELVPDSEVVIDEN